MAAGDHDLVALAHTAEDGDPLPVAGPEVRIEPDGTVWVRRVASEDDGCGAIAHHRGERDCQFLRCSLERKLERARDARPCPLLKRFGDDEKLDRPRIRVRDRGDRQRTGNGRVRRGGRRPDCDPGAHSVAQPAEIGLQRLRTEPHLGRVDHGGHESRAVDPPALRGRNLVHLPGCAGADHQRAVTPLRGLAASGPRQEQRPSCFQRAQAGLRDAPRRFQFRFLGRHFRKSDLDGAELGACRRDLRSAAAPGVPDALELGDAVGP